MAEVKFQYKEHEIIVSLNEKKQVEMISFQGIGKCSKSEEDAADQPIIDSFYAVLEGEIDQRIPEDKRYKVPKQIEERHDQSIWHPHTQGKLVTHLVSTTEGSCFLSDFAHEDMNLLHKAITHFVKTHAKDISFHDRFSFEHGMKERLFREFFPEALLSAQEEKERKNSLQRVATLLQRPQQEGGVSKRPIPATVLNMIMEYEADDGESALDMEEIKTLGREEKFSSLAAVILLGGAVITAGVTALVSNFNAGNLVAYFNTSISSQLNAWQVGLIVFGAIAVSIIAGRAIKTVVDHANCQKQCQSAMLSGA